MEESKQIVTLRQPTPAGTFSVKIKNTTYVVGAHFSKTTKDNLEDKMKRVMLDDVKTANFSGKNSEDIPSKILTTCSLKN